MEDLPSGLGDRGRYPAWLDQRKQLNVDQLTGLETVPSLIAELERITSETGRNGTFSAALINIDNTKLFNAHNGWAKGDLLIKQVANRVSAALTPEHSVYRSGGDSFIALFDSASHDESVVAAEQIRKTIENIGQTIQQPLSCGDANCNGPATVTASIGLATISKDTKMSCSEIVQKLGELLDHAKQRGRNQISSELHTE